MASEVFRRAILAAAFEFFSQEAGHGASGRAKPQAVGRLAAKDMAQTSVEKLRDGPI
jgi:hypothetical protein